MPPPAAAQILRSPVHLLAFGFGAGLSPRAPGTVGTLVGIPFWFALAWLPLWAYCAVTAVLFVAGCGICGSSARRLGVHDYGGIVFDEIVGYLVTAVPLLLWPAPRAEGLAAAFVLFRVFDIWKPWPIRALDRHVEGGLGIMLDDLVAGLFAAAGLAAMLYALS